jgi:RND superfamily putative drug exporter
MSIAGISRFVLRHKLLVVLFWVVVTVAGVLSAGPATAALSQRFDLPGRESSEANAAIVARYGNGGFVAPYVVAIVLLPGTTVDSPGVADALGVLFDQVTQVAPELRVASYASTQDRAFVSQDGRATFGLIYPRSAGAGAAAVKTAIAGATIPGAEITVAGLGENSAPSEGGSNSVLIETLVGAGGALIVLLWVFGSFLALLPLLVAGVSILTCFLLVWGLASLTDVSFLIQFLIALIGLGVAIDYSLLVVTRWREERAAGRENAAAVQRAMETAGHAVVFSGTTVAISLLALVALPVPFLRSVGLGGMLIPLVSGAVSVTLLPVVLATVGPRLDWPRLRAGDQVSHLWERWARLVVRRRWLAALVGLALLAAVTLPAFSLRLTSPASSSFTGDSAAIVALERAAIPPGADSPFEVLVNEADPTDVARRLQGVDGVVAAVAPTGANWRRAGTSIVLVLPRADGSDGEGRATLSRVRDAAHALPGGIKVGGAVAGDADFIDAVYGNFIPMLALILAVTFVLLVRAFRSLLLPLKAVILNCLSVGAAYGVLVLVWQQGHGTELIWGVAGTGAIPSWLPLMVFSFLFGLSMDYEVFILARMREEYDLTGSTPEAVVRGMSHTTRLVTTAAIILFLAFVSLAAVPQTAVKIMATGLAAGILIDATVIRTLLVPATVALMGRWNWWLPAWLERFVPAGVHGAPSHGPTAGSDAD